MMFALVSIIYPSKTMVDQYTDITEHLQTFNVDYLGTSKMDIQCISWLCSNSSKHSNCVILLPSHQVLYEPVSGIGVFLGNNKTTN